VATEVVVRLRRLDDHWVDIEILRPDGNIHVSKEFTDVEFTMLQDVINGRKAH